MSKKENSTFPQTFLVSLIMDFSSSRMENIRINAWLLSRSCVANFAGSLMVFASVIVVGLPEQTRQETSMYKERERVRRDNEEKKILDD